jgi:dTDP-glucose pyrophosphorylase
MTLRNIQLVIPAAGLGTRFSNVGYKTSKPLIKVGSHEMILWVVSNFGLIAGDSIVVISRDQDDLGMVRSRISPAINFYNIKVSSVTEGPASTVNLARETLSLELPLIIANSDQYVSASLAGFIAEVRTGIMDGSVLTMNATGNKWSYVERKPNGDIKRVVEKEQISDEATVGIYAWKNANLYFNSYDEMLTSEDRVNGEFYVAPTYNYLIREGLRIGAFHIGNVEDAVHGLGTPEDLDLFITNSNFHNWDSIVGTTIESNTQ